MWKKIKAILDKSIRGEALSEDEKKVLSEYVEPQPNAELQAELDRLKSEKEEAENRSKPELEQLKNANEKLSARASALEKERNDAITARTALEFSNSVSALAAKHKFSDPEYLKYLITGRNVDIADAKAADVFIEGLKKDNPKYFAAEVPTGGGGTPPGALPAGTGGNKARIDELLRKPELSLSEAAEISKLQDEINNTQKQGE